MYITIEKPDKLINDKYSIPTNNISKSGLLWYATPFRKRLSEKNLKSR